MSKLHLELLILIRDHLSNGPGPYNTVPAMQALDAAVEILRAVEPTEDEESYCDRMVESKYGVAMTTSELVHERALARAPLQAENARFREAMRRAASELRCIAGGLGIAEVLEKAMENTK